MRTLLLTFLFLALVGCKARKTVSDIAVSETLHHTTDAQATHTSDSERHESSQTYSDLGTVTTLTDEVTTYNDSGVPIQTHRRTLVRDERNLQVLQSNSDSAHADSSHVAVGTETEATNQSQISTTRTSEPASSATSVLVLIIIMLCIIALLIYIYRWARR